MTDNQEPPNNPSGPMFKGKPADPFDWQAFWRDVDRGTVLNIENVTFDGLGDAAGLARLRGCIFTNRVRFSKCHFRAPVDLSETRFEQSLHLVECTFDMGLTLRNVEVRTRLSLQGSTVRDDDRFWLDWRGLRTGADLSLMGVTAHAPIDLYNATIGADLRLDGLHALAKGRTEEEALKTEALGIVDRHHVANKVAGKAINLEGADIGRHVYGNTFAGRSMTVKGTLDLRATITGGIYFASAAIGAGADGMAINLWSADIGGAVFFTHDTLITGTVDLRAKVGSGVQVSKSIINAGTGGTALQMESAVVGGPVFFIERTRVTGKIVLRAKVLGQVNFDSAIIDAGIVRTAVDMEGAEIGGAVFFQNGTTVTGTVNMRAKVMGQVAFHDVIIEVSTKITESGTPQRAVNMESAEIGGSVLFKEFTRVKGPVDLRAQIAGGVNFTNTVIEAGTHRTAVTMETAKIGGPVFINRRALIIGSVSLFAARLGGGLGSMIDYNAITFSRDGSGNEQSKSRHLLITGGLDLRFADITGPAIIHSASVLGPIRARHLSVHGDFHACGGVVGTIDQESRKELDAFIGAFIETYRTLHTAHIDSLNALSVAPTRTEELKSAVTATAQMISAHFDSILPASSRSKGWQPWDTASTPAEADQTAIDLELADIHGHVWIKGMRVLGTVNLDDAEVIGDACFDRTIITGDLRLRSATVRGKVFASSTDFADTADSVDPTDSTPSTDSAGPCPQVTGRVDARGATLAQVRIDLRSPGDGETPKVILLDGATVTELEVRGTPPESIPYFSVHRLNFGDLSLDDFSAGSRVGFTVRDWMRTVAFGILIALAGLSLHFGGWPPGGWIVAAIIAVYTFLACILNRRVLARLGKVLPRQPVLDFLDATHFSAAFYVAVERWARAAGDDPLADEVFLKRRRRELSERRTRFTEHGTPRAASKSEKNEPTTRETDNKKSRQITPDFGLATWLWRWCVLDIVFGYGVRTSRVVHLFLLLWLLNLAVFLSPYSVERPLSFEVAATASAEAAQAEIDHRAAQATTPDTPNPWPGEGGRPGPDDHWGVQRAFFMALRLQIPLVDLFVDQPWKPADRAMFADGKKTGGISLTYENYAAAMRAINLILLPIVIAGVAGFLKPRDRGEKGT
jgi:hypothetical protein